MAIQTFRAFSSRNYRLYFLGQSVSLVGTWMQRTAVTWVVYMLTHSPLMLGLSVFATQFPSFLLSLFGGVISDRYDRFKVLLFTQFMSLIQAVILAGLVLWGVTNVWVILGLGVMLGIINAFDVPARQSLVYEMVDDKSHLPNALALNSSMVNLARLIGPTVSGMVLQWYGAATCFGINALSFVAVLSSLMLMRLPPHKVQPNKKKVLQDLVEGVVYLKRTPAIGTIILMLASVSLLVLPFNTLLPIYAKVIFEGNAATFGYINSFIGLGAISGTFFLASLKPGVNLRRILLINTCVFGVGLVSFAYCRYFPAAMFFAVLSGFGMMSQTTICNTIIQTGADKMMRGRVISFFAMAFFGMMPLGSLLIGAVSQWMGTQATLFAEGVAALLIAAIFAPFLKKSRLDEEERRELLKEEVEEMRVV